MTHQQGTTNRQRTRSLVRCTDGLLPDGVSAGLVCHKASSDDDRRGRSQPESPHACRCINCPRAKIVEGKGSSMLGCGATHALAVRLCCLHIINRSDLNSVSSSMYKSGQRRERPSTTAALARATTVARKAANNYQSSDDDRHNRH